MGLFDSFDSASLTCATSLPGWSLEVQLTRNPWRLHATAIGVLPLPPGDVAAIMNSSEGDAVFRIESRVIAETSVSGRSEQEVVFMAPMRVLFWKAWSRTTTQVVTKALPDGTVVMNFDLIRADLMSELQGSWMLTPVLDAGGKVIGTHMHYSLSMWPKGVPTSLACVPGLFTAVQTAVGKEVMQTVEKIQFCAHMAASNGWSVRHALCEASRLVLAKGSFKQCVAATGDAWRTTAITATSSGCRAAHGSSAATASAASLDSDLSSLHLSRNNSGDSNESSSSGGGLDARISVGSSSSSTAVRVSMDDDSAVDQAPAAQVDKAYKPAASSKAGRIRAAAGQQTTEPVKQIQQDDMPNTTLTIGWRGWW